MKKILQLILSLTLISAVCAAVLAIVNNATKERIANLATLKANNAARAVLPASVKAIEPVKDPADASLTAFIGYADDAKTQVAGYAVPGLTAKGYGGNIRLMVGLNPDRTVISASPGASPGIVRESMALTDAGSTARAALLALSVARFAMRSLVAAFTMASTAAQTAEMSVRERTSCRVFFTF